MRIIHAHSPAPKHVESTPNHPTRRTSPAKASTTLGRPSPRAAYSRDLRVLFCLDSHHPIGSDASFIPKTSTPLRFKFARVPKVPPRNLCRPDLFVGPAAETQRSWIVVVRSRECAYLPLPPLLADWAKCSATIHSLP